jgi:hypothetical protein
VIIISFHTMITVFPAVVIAFPRPSAHTISVNLWIGFFGIFGKWAGLFFDMIQFYPQHLQILERDGSPGAVSLLSLALQSLVLGILASRWLLRLGQPTWENTLMPIDLWSDFVAFSLQWGQIPVLYMIHAVGNLLLLCSYQM